MAGYTDATGDEKSNQQLSLRRAEAVRNWMLQTSDILATCFAVQGLGESQPAATNDTPQGRQSTGVSKSVLFRVLTPVRT